MLRYPVAFGHNAFAFNEHINADGSFDRTKVKNTVVLDSRELPVAEFREGREALHLAQGGTLGRSHKGLLYLPLRGRILVPDASQQATLADRERAMRAAFDPFICYSDSPSTDGAYALDFTEPTADTANYPTGRILLRYYVRPLGHPRIGESLAEEAARSYSLNLVAADPRQYEQTEQTLALTPGSPSGIATNKGNTAAPWRLTIVASAGASATFTITRTGQPPLILNLSAFAGTYVVTSETCGPYGQGRLVTLSGVSAFNVKVSDALSWFTLQPGNNTITITNTANITSATLKWFHARA